MSSSKIIILTICLAMVGNSLASPRQSATTGLTDLQQSCTDAVSQCQTLLLAVTVNVALAVILATALLLVVLPLLLSLCVSLVAATTIIIATKLIAILLACLILIIKIVIQFLMGLISLATCNTKIDACVAKCIIDLTAAAGGNTVILNLCLTVLAQIVVIIKLCITV